MDSETNATIIPFNEFGHHPCSKEGTSSASAVHEHVP